MQLQLKTLDAELAREMRIYDRQTALEVIKEQKRQNNSPIWLVAEDLLHSNPNQSLIPLRIFFSPPSLKYDRSSQNNEINKGFPEMEQALTKDLRNFFEKYTIQGRLIEFLGGAWTSNFFYGEAATRSIFRGLKTEPALILESLVEGDYFDLNFGFWGLNWSGYRYKSAFSLSWREALYEFVKIRAWRWKQNLEAHIAAGKNPADFEKRYGMETVKRFQRNLEILEREQQCIEDGYDPTEIERPYSVHQNDYEELREFLATCHCLFAGVLVDEYFLFYVNPQVRLRPLLPQLLPDLLKKVPEPELQELIEILVTFYQNLYENIEKDESGWIPELALDLAEGLMGLPQKHWAKGRVIYSIKSWLKLRGLSPEADELESLLPVMESALMIDDIAYVGQLNSCLKQLGETHQISVINACYNRGIKRCQQGEYSAAIYDFTQVMQINPNFPEANYNRGLAYGKLGQFPAAIEDYTQALRLHPNHAEAYNNRGNAYYKLGEYEKAIADYNSALSLNPNLPGVAHNRDVAQGVWDEKVRQRREEEERIRWEEEERQRWEREFDVIQEIRCEFVEVITVNAQGKGTNGRRWSAEFFKEDLGNGVILEMVKIAGGNFMMGSPTTESNRNDNESPQHQVDIAPFDMGKYPITQAQWKVVAALPKINIDLNSDPSNFKGANRPVENVNWHEAQEFCQRLSQKTGKTYRLPSEAEWEYACRAVTTTPFLFGETITVDLANYDGNYTYAAAPKGIYRQQTTDVGSFPPNAFGLYDMHGNVWEWCADLWHDNYNNAPSDGSVWESGGNNDFRLIRGGSWGDYPWHCRSAFRNRIQSDSRNGNVGFRVVALTSARTL